MFKKPYFGIKDPKTQGLAFSGLLLASAFLLTVLPGAWRFLSLATLTPVIKLVADAVREITVATYQKEKRPG